MKWVEVTNMPRWFYVHFYALRGVFDKIFGKLIVAYWAIYRASFTKSLMGWIVSGFWFLGLMSCGEIIQWML